MTYQLTTLPNGLRVATESLPGAESISINILVDAGARNETIEENGLSHFLEHMAFKGTAKRDARLIAEAFDDIGGNSNAYTSHEHTVYFARVLPQDSEVALDILADILQNSVFDEDEVEREREVILQEIAMQQDQPEELSFDAFQSTVFSGQPLGRTILGDPNRISIYHRDNLINYMKKHYFAETMVVAAAGQVDHDKFVKQCESLFSFSSKAPKRKIEPASFHAGEYREEHPWEQLHLYLGFPGANQLEDDYYAWHLMALILGGGMSSRLFQEVREKRGLVYHVSSSHAAYADTGLFSIYAATGSNKAGEVVPVICEEAKRLADSISESELARAKKQHMAMVLMARENNASVSEWIARHLTVFGEYRDSKKLKKRIEAISLADMKRIAGSLQEKPPVAFTALGPLGSLEDYPSIQKRFC